MKKIAVIFGTRPDTIKMAPIIKSLYEHPQYFKVLTIATAQHRQMLDQVLDVFNIKPDYDLNIMQPRQTLATVTARTIIGLDEILENEKPDMVLVQGDTSTTFVGSLAAFYHQIPVGHVEAGLRTNDPKNPFPEEINRRLTSCMTDLHFAPTETAMKALLKEGYSRDKVFVTGNTVVDALKYSVRKNYRFTVDELNKISEKQNKIVLITMHRRENWGKPMEGAANAVKRLSEKYKDYNFVFPVHLNPVVRDIVYPVLQNKANVSLIEPLDYLPFVDLMRRAYLLITDSGGVQEEGPSLGKPILVLRDKTERPEAVHAGTVKLVGTDVERIVREASALLDNPVQYEQMARLHNPYGDGKACARIAETVATFLGAA